MTVDQLLAAAREELARLSPAAWHAAGLHVDRLAGAGRSG